MLSQKKLFIYLSKIYLFNFKFKLNLFIYHKFLILTHLLKRFLQFQWSIFGPFFLRKVTLIWGALFGAGWGIQSVSTETMEMAVFRT